LYNIIKNSINLKKDKFNKKFTGKLVINLSLMISFNIYYRSDIGTDGGGIDGLFDHTLTQL